MCGIVGVVSLRGTLPAGFEGGVKFCRDIIAHRGPDAAGLWVSPRREAIFGHRRLSIIDLASHADQPMSADNETTIAFNGEIYNYLELKERLGTCWSFKTQSDTETMLAAYDAFGTDMLNCLRGMFAFALWDEKKKRFFAARDRFGIKPFFYAIQHGHLYFASEVKALLPFLDDIATDSDGLSEYLTYQLPLTNTTLFANVKQLLPGEMMVVQDGNIRISRYYDLPVPNVDPTCKRKDLVEVIDESLKVHLRADVEIGTMLSGGFDSSMVTIRSAEIDENVTMGFHGRFLEFPGYDESEYAEIAAEVHGTDLRVRDITGQDFVDSIESVIHQLDYPIAGPGSFPQYMVSKLASESVKVVLGGQGGDEIFGGYSRYLIGYLGEALKAAISGKPDAKLPFSLNEISPRLNQLYAYQSLLDDYLRDGLQDPFHMKFHRLVDRGRDLGAEINPDAVNREHALAVYENAFSTIPALSTGNYYDMMAAFELTFLLPGLLHVEDRMSMAHSIESRVPLVDQEVVEFASRLSPSEKYPGGRLKGGIIDAFSDVVPSSITSRKDKMGFPVPLKEWMNGTARDFVMDVFSSQNAKSRGIYFSDLVIKNLSSGKKHSRKLWGLLSLELWHRSFHDRATETKAKFNASIAAAKTGRSTAPMSTPKS